MRNLFQLFALFAVTTVFVSIGCKDDPIDPTFTTPPSADFAESHPNALNGPYPTTDVETANLNQYVYVLLEAIAGTGDINAITITEDGVKLGTDRLTMYDLAADAPITTNNPLLILGDNTGGFSIEIGIDPQDDFSTKTYAFEIGADDGEITTLAFNITTIDPGTPISTTLEGVLLNQAGPAGQGGLDLDDGSSTGTLSSSPTAIDAEIKDEGIDLSLPNDQNWKARISGINDSEVRIPGAGFPEDFMFDNVSTKEEIKGYFDGGEQLPDLNSSNEAISDPVQVGDIFLVTRDDVYYLLEVTAVNPTVSNNNDNIVFDIKY